MAKNQVIKLDIVFYMGGGYYRLFGSDGILKGLYVCDKNGSISFPLRGEEYDLALAWAKDIIKQGLK